MPCVLVAIDGSERSLTALPYASALAKAAGLDIELVTVVSPVEDIVVYGEVAKERIERRQLAIRHDLARAALEAGIIAGVDAVLSDMGESTVATLRRLADERVALIVAMTSRGADLARRVLVGSFPLEFVREAHVPALLVGERARDRAPGYTPPEGPYHLLCPVGPEPGATDVIRAVLPALDSGKFIFTLLHVLDPDRPLGAREADTLLREAERLLPEDIPAERLVVPMEQERLSATIVAVAQRKNASAIALSTEPGALPRWLGRGSTSLDVLRRSDIPLLLVHR